MYKVVQCRYTHNRHTYPHMVSERVWACVAVHGSAATLHFNMHDTILESCARMNTPNVMFTRTVCARWHTLHCVLCLDNITHTYQCVQQPWTNTKHQCLTLTFQHVVCALCVNVMQDVSIRTRICCYVHRTRDIDKVKTFYTPHRIHKQMNYSRSAFMCGGWLTTAVNAYTHRTRTQISGTRTIWQT